MEYATFFIHDDLFGIPLFLVQEISRIADIYPIPGHDPRIKGVVNLRGRTAVVLNLSACLYSHDTSQSHAERPKLIILETKDWIGEKFKALAEQAFEEQIVLMVDDVYKIIDDEKQDFFEPPAHVHEKYVEGVMKNGNTLITLLSIKKLLEDLMPQEETTGYDNRK
jgi:chemotaxis signal transduction protein